MATPASPPQHDKSLRRRRVVVQSPSLGADGPGADSPTLTDTPSVSSTSRSVSPDLSMKRIDSAGSAGSRSSRRRMRREKLAEDGGSGRRMKLDTLPRDFSATLHVEGNRVKVVAPGTPWNEIDLSDSFLAHTYQKPPGLFKRRRWFFIIGGLMGAFLGWLFTEGPHPFPEGVFTDFDFDSTLMQVRGAVAESTMLSQLGIGKGFNLTDVFNAAGRSWIKNTNFQVGREVLSQGAKKKFAIVLVPGIVSSGLESWSTSEEAAPFFRQRIWGTAGMIRAVLTRKEAWIRAMTLDPETGLDPQGVKVRSAQGFDAAAFFMTGYWIWQKILENLAVLDYDQNDMTLAAYDWRLSYINLEIRDSYFSRMKSHIEHNKFRSGKKTVLVSHSMGGSVVLFFLKWVEAEGYGNGGPRWVEDHIANFVNIAGTILGVPKAMAALLSGEMRDTVELSPAGVYLLEKFFSRRERTSLFRSWGGAASMWPKGGNTVWGDHTGSPDDPDNATLTSGYAYYFRKANEDGSAGDGEVSNMTMDAAFNYLLHHSSNQYNRMLSTNYSVGFERDAKQIAKNDQIMRTWANPLETRLPNAPSMKIFCLYGVGKSTERGYWYKAGQYGPDGFATDPNSQCESNECNNTTTRSRLDFPFARQVYVDSEVSMDEHRPKVSRGVTVGDGDGTVSVLSLGGMCVRGWKSRLYNPAGIKVVTREFEHLPQGFDIRGGPTTADHIDILGSSELNEAVLNVACGREDKVTQNIISKVEEHAAKIDWPK